MVEKLLHPERTWPGESLAYKRLQRLWEDAADPSFGKQLQGYLLSFTNLPGGASRKLLEEYAEAMLFPVLEGLIARSSDKDSYSATGASTAGIEMQQIMRIMLPDGNTSNGAEQLMSSVLAHYANLRWLAHNKPTYTVAGDLSEALQHTQLRNYPSNMLSLPFPALYLELPPGVFHVAPSAGQEEAAPAEGVYILQETNLEHKAWRFVVASPEEKDSKGGLELRNTSIWFFSMEFPEGQPVDACICYTVEKFSTPEYIETRVIDGHKVDVIRGLEEPQLERFQAYKSHMIDLFRYVMNVMIYVTSAEADITYWNASKEYRDLKARAIKAKGPKREGLNTRLKSTLNQPRILLGKNVVIDRKREKLEGSDGEKRSMKVRSYVPGYWNTYHVGKGRTQTIAKLVKPHFRGPEEAPLTTPARHIVK